MPKKIEDKDLSDAMNRAQLEKLKLEIKQLKKKTGKFERFAIYGGLFSAVVALAVLLFNITQYNSQQRTAHEAQRRDQDIRIQQQINSAMAEMLQLPKEEKITTAKASFLLTDLKSFITLKHSNDPDDVAAADEIMKISDKFTHSAMHDCNFDQPRDTLFYFALLSYWDDFQPHLQRNPASITFILGKFMDSLEKYRALDPKYVRKMTFDSDKIEYRYPLGTVKLNPIQAEHHRQLLTNFRSTYLLLDNEERKELGVVYFQSATCNPELAEQMLGRKLDQKLHADLKHCAQ